MQLKAAKRGGPDGAIGLDIIPIEIWNTDQFFHYLLDLCNLGLVDHIKPSQWSQSSIVHIYKKGDTSIQANYRGIGLNAIAAKQNLTICRPSPELDSKWISQIKINLV